MRENNEGDGKESEVRVKERERRLHQVVDSGRQWLFPTFLIKPLSVTNSSLSHQWSEQYQTQTS